ncbi:FtsW/RodA/SpoVE family cell cycle protein [Massiliimalia massiliensis]|uniref:FtsW/RodA/SpoVE family cell cycle protein n=1 Tax=Massiliimalia massiliensis TaxID=1852384 RepID=UPI000987190D|nr:FtsW/RodA/SpoVE family cell cycle protein [Massiliimalia massiliensis]
MEQVIAFLNTYYLVIARFLFVIYAVIILIQLKRCMFHRSETTKVLAVLNVEDGAIRLPITHYETTIGRSKACDVVVPLPVMSRQHAVLSMEENGMWKISDTNSNGGISVNGEDLEQDSLISVGDEISMAGVKMRLSPPSRYTDEDSEEKGWLESRWERFRRKFRRRAQKLGSVNVALGALSLFQVLAFLQLYITLPEKYMPSLVTCFVVLLILPWVYKFSAYLLGIRNITAEAIAFFLTTIGFCTTASAAPYSLIKELLAFLLGIVIFCVMCGILRNLNLVMKLRRYAGIISILVLAVNLLLGVTKNGQKNWIDLGFVSVQPSEFVKILFVFAGAATLEWLLTTKNLTRLIVYATGCIGLLFLMGDFGTALIFFFTFLVLIFMTSGDVRAIILTCVSAGMGGLLILFFKPYIMNRFAAWGHVWEHVNDSAGFQQTRTLMASASGGLLGIGGGNGFLKQVFAADTDLVFGVICEEWGLLIALLVVACYILFLLGAIRSRKTTYSSYHIIAACTAASIFLFQASLNIFGATDVLPITGVTLPFVSNGGSSIAASWGLLSFITAALNYTRPKMKRNAASEWEPSPRTARKRVVRR